MPAEWAKELDVQGYSQIDLDAAVNEVLSDQKRMTGHAPQAQWLEAFHRVSPQDIRAIVMGQDPYPQPQLATGLAFDTAGRTLSNSLNKIVKVLEMRPNDPLHQVSRNFKGDLLPWTKEGVLLLNASYTFHGEDQTDRSRSGYGVTIWNPLNRAVLRHVNSKRIPILLLGSKAKKHESYVGSSNYAIVTSHPVIEGSRAGSLDVFSKSDAFGRANDWLRSEGKAPINWSL